MQLSDPIVDAINTPRPFDWLSLSVTLVTAAVPVVITIILWRKDRRALVASSERARRGEIQRRLGDAVAEILDARRDFDLARIGPRTPRLVASITSLQERDDRGAIDWALRAMSVISAPALDAVFTTPGGLSLVTSSEELARRAMEYVERWARDPASVDFDQLLRSPDWSELRRASPLGRARLLSPFADETAADDTQG